MQSVHSFIRMQGTICAIINIVLNPVIAWLGNRQMQFVPVVGENSIVVDTAVTSVVLSLLVTLFTVSGTRKALHAGTIHASSEFSQAGFLLTHLPQKAWPLGLLIGFAVACIFTPFIYWIFHVVGLAGLPFAWFALFKALYTGPMGFIVTRWVVHRQLLLR